MMGTAVLLSRSPTPNPKGINGGCLQHGEPGGGTGVGIDVGVCVGLDVGVSVCRWRCGCKYR